MWKLGKILDNIIDNSFLDLNYIKEPFNDTKTLEEWKNIYGYIFDTGEMADFRQNQPKWTNDIKNYLDLKLPASSYYRMTPGKILPYHKDTFNRYINHYNIVDPKMIHRAVIFLEDWKPGHIFEIDGYPITKYRAGTYVLWKYDTPHMAANIGFHNRYTLQLTGIL